MELEWKAEENGNERSCGFRGDGAGSAAVSCHSSASQQGRLVTRGMVGRPPGVTGADGLGVEGVGAGGPLYCRVSPISGGPPSWLPGECPGQLGRTLRSAGLSIGLTR